MSFDVTVQHDLKKLRRSLNALETKVAPQATVRTLNPGGGECQGCQRQTHRLTDGQFDALVSFTFNLGSGALQRSTLRRKVNREEHDEVPEQFMRWVWAGGRRLRGLVRRREAEGVVYSI